MRRAVRGGTFVLLAFGAARCGADDPSSDPPATGDDASTADVVIGEESSTLDSGVPDNASPGSDGSQDGSLDAGPGPGTLIETYAGNGFPVSFYGGALAVDAQGRAYVGGECPAVVGGAIHPGVVRLTVAGDLDTTFGTNGMKCFTVAVTQYGWVATIAIAPDGEVFMAGQYRPDACVGCPSRTFFARMSNSGLNVSSTQTKWPDGGPGYTGRPFDIAPTGSFVGAGSSAFVADDAGVIELASINELFSVRSVPEGLMSAGGATGGIRVMTWADSPLDASVVTPMPASVDGGPTWSGAEGIDAVREPGGTNLVAVRASASPASHPILVLRTQTNGVVDSTFGGANGYVTTNLAAQFGLGGHLALGSSGFYVIGSSSTNASVHAIVKFNLNGTPAAFGTNGRFYVGRVGDMVFDGPRDRILVLSGSRQVTAVRP